jgi:hypothetical protein
LIMAASVTIRQSKTSYSPLKGGRMASPRITEPLVSSPDESPMQRSQNAF